MRFGMNLLMWTDTLSDEMLPLLEDMIRNFYFMADRMLRDTPFGQAKVLMGRAADIEIPSWKEGSTLYVLSTAYALLRAVETVPENRFLFHAERQLQYVFGYNELRRNLVLNRKNMILSLRSSGTDGRHPGERSITRCPDILKAMLYIALAAGELHLQLK